MYKFLDYSDKPAVLLDTEKGGLRGILLVNSKWRDLDLGEIAKQGYVIPELQWRTLFERELKDAPKIPKS